METTILRSPVLWWAHTVLLEEFHLPNLWCICADQLYCLVEVIYYTLCLCLQISKRRHPLRNGTIKFIYLKKIVWGIWGKAQKDINIKESKCRLFKYRELSWESEHRALEKLTLVLYFEALQDFLSAGWPEAELGIGEARVHFFPLESFLLALHVNLHLNWDSLLSLLEIDILGAMKIAEREKSFWVWWPFSASPDLLDSSCRLCLST